MMNIQVTRNPKFLTIAKSSDREKGDFELWGMVKRDFLRSLFENKPGSLLTTSEHFMEDIPINKPESLLKINSDPRKTYIMSNDTWKMDDLYEIANSMSFELGELWMMRDLDCRAAQQMTIGDAREFWRFVGKLMLEFNKDVPVGPIEMIGCVNDGDWLLWSNPEPNDVELILENLKRLCQTLNIRLE